MGMGKVSNCISKIKESSCSGKWLEVLSLYSNLNKAGVHITEPSSFHPIMKACSAVSLRHGKSLHASAIKLGLQESCTSIGNSIMDFYAKAGLIDSAFNVFTCMNIKDSVSWNILISAQLNHGLFDEGISSFTRARSTTGFEPNVSTLLVVIRSHATLLQAQKMHGYMIKTDFLSVSSLQNSLLSVYAAADMEMKLAQKLFDEMSNRDVIAWSVMISGYVKSNQPCVALAVFKEMLSRFGSEVDGQMIVSALKACTYLNRLITGRTLHGFVFRKGFYYDLFLGNSLVDMYFKCNEPDSALQAWKDMPLKNIISWNSLLTGLVCNEKHSEAISLFNSMQKAGIEPDAVTLVNLLQACKHFQSALICKCIHTVIIRKYHDLNEFILAALIDVYAKCNLIYLAWKLFNSTKSRDTVLWSTMIAAFTYCGLPCEAIKVYHEMIQTQEKPNSVTILNLIEACSYDTELKRPKCAHGIAIRKGFASDANVGTAILDMYSRYGDIINSEKAFNQISNKTVISFSAMIASYGMNGLPHDALRLLNEMEKHGLKPNSITILSVLSACSHGGLINEGLSFFQKLIKGQEVKPSLEHYSCLVDLLSRGGKLDLAMELIKQLAKQEKITASSWGALLSGCSTNKNVNEKILEKVVSYVVELEPNNSCGYMLASNMYATRGLWDQAARVRALVKDKCIKVVAGYSMVHVNNECHKFIAGDSSQLLSNEIRATIEELHEFMKTEKIQVESSCGGGGRFKSNLNGRESSSDVVGATVSSFSQ